ncbi:efflux transporter outer membrane subunit [Rheinheimera sp.]|uniref:efflux transporter outer membrane subunit n=1 Tax=Rheinheimera sp. TaxID=1869214 RepID=UPI002FDD3C18
MAKLFNTNLNTKFGATLNMASNSLLPKPRLALLALVVSTVLGCATVGPDYQRPAELNTSMAMPEVGSAMALPDNATLWWQKFQDAELNRLIQIALEQNQQLAKAEANVARAYAVFADSNDNLWPKAALDSSYQATRTPAEVAGAANSQDGNALYNRQSQLRGTLSWDLDLTGKLKRASEAANARAESAVFAWQDAQIGIIAQVAQSYGDYRGAELRLAVAKQNLANMQQTEKLILARRDAGMASDLELARIKAQLYQLEASLPQFETAKSRAFTTLAALLGLSPQQLQLQQTAAGTPALPELKQPQAIAVAKDLLRHRPDIAQTERQLAASTADIGVATADLYPNVSVSGFLGFISAPGLTLGSDQRAWSVAPSLSWQGADWTSVQARIKAAKASEQMALADFRQQVLNALRDMQFSLESYNLSRRQQLIQQQQVAATSTAVALSKARFDAGNADFLELLDAERELLAARDEQARLSQQNFQLLVALYRSFAGGIDLT